MVLCGMPLLMLLRQRSAQNFAWRRMQVLAALPFALRVPAMGNGSFRFPAFYEIRAHRFLFMM